MHFNLIPECTNEMLLNLELFIKYGSECAAAEKRPEVEVATSRGREGELREVDQRNTNTVTAWK